MAAGPCVDPRREVQAVPLEVVADYVGDGQPEGLALVVGGLGGVEALGAPELGRDRRADLAGLPAPKTDGVSLRPLLDDPAAPWDRPAYTQVSRGTPTATGETTGKKPWFMGRSVRTERYRYTEWDGGKKGVQLYDYETDPGELKNLADDPAQAEVVRKMKALLAAPGR